MTRILHSTEIRAFLDSLGDDEESRERLSAMALQLAHAAIYWCRLSYADTGAMTDAFGRDPYSEPRLGDVFATREGGRFTVIDVHDQYFRALPSDSPLSIVAPRESLCAGRIQKTSWPVEVRPRMVTALGGDT